MLCVASNHILLTKNLIFLDSDFFVSNIPMYEFRFIMARLRMRHDCAAGSVMKGGNGDSLRRYSVFGKSLCTYKRCWK
jgi:hypothetical protein